MNKRNRNQPTGMLHPRVYLTLIALAVWFVLSAWGFSANGQTDYLLAVVSGLVFVAVIIPCVLWRMAYRKSANSADDDASTQSFRDWAAQDFETWQDRVRGLNAQLKFSRRSPLLHSE